MSKLEEFPVTSNNTTYIIPAAHIPKLFSLLIYLNFCLGFLFMWKKQLDQKVRVISKFMTSQSG